MANALSTVNRSVGRCQNQVPMIAPADRASWTRLDILLRQRLARPERHLRHPARLDVAEHDQHLAAAGRLDPRRRHLDMPAGLFEIAFEADRLAVRSTSP